MTFAQNRRFDVLTMAFTGKFIHTSLPVNAIVRLPHSILGAEIPRPGNVLAPSADNPTRNYDAECSNLDLTLSTLESKGLRD